MNILLIGPQGSGKGTQAEILVEKSGLFYLEIGGLLREAAKTNKEIDKIMNVGGKLIPDDITFSLVIDRVEKIAPKKDSILFDGFPRTTAQYEMLSTWLKDFGKKVDIAILIDIPEEESIKRLSARRKCTKCGKIWNLVTSPKPPTDTTCDCGGELYQRKDDTPEAIKTRLQIYKDTIGKLLKILEEKKLLVRVDGMRSIEAVTEQILTSLKNWQQ